MVHSAVRQWKCTTRIWSGYNSVRCDKLMMQGRTNCPLTQATRMNYNKVVNPEMIENVVKEAEEEGVNIVAGEATAVRSWSGGRGAAISGGGSGTSGAKNSRDRAGIRDESSAEKRKSPTRSVSFVDTAVAQSPPESKSEPGVDEDDTTAPANNGAPTQEALPVPPPFGEDDKGDDYYASDYYAEIALEKDQLQRQADELQKELQRARRETSELVQGLQGSATTGGPRILGRFATAASETAYHEELLNDHRIIHPRYWKKIVWDVIAGLFIIFSVIVVPYRIGLNRKVEPWTVEDYFDMLTDLVFLEIRDHSWRFIYDEQDERYVVYYTCSPYAYPADSVERNECSAECERVCTCISRFFTCTSFQVFSIDILLTFRTAYEDNSGTLVTDPDKVLWFEQTGSSHLKVVGEVVKLHEEVEFWAVTWSNSGVSMIHVWR